MNYTYQKQLRYKGGVGRVAGSLYLRRPQKLNLLCGPFRKKGKQGKKHLKNHLEEPPVDIPGIRQVLSATNVFSRLLWVVAIVVFYSLLTYQLADRITTYFEHPVSIKQNVLKYSSVEFPSVTVCPTHTSDILRSICRNNRTRNGEDFASELENFWQSGGIPLSMINTSISCSKEGENDTCDLDLPTEMRDIRTLFGNCTTINLRNNVTYRGAETFFVVTIDFTTANPNVHAMFILHSSSEMPLHEIAKQKKYVTTGYNVDVRFHYRQVHFLNTRPNPCVDSRTEEKCKNDCMNKYLDKILHCRLPFMNNSTLKVCKTAKQFCKSYDDLIQAYKEYDGCKCPRRCQEKLVGYNFDSYARPEKDRKIIIKLLFPDNVVEIVKEAYTYTLSALLSDLGGNLGCCVGLCLFNFVELFERTFRVIILKVVKTV